MLTIIGHLSTMSPPILQFSAYNAQFEGGKDSSPVITMFITSWQMRQQLVAHGLVPLLTGRCWAGQAAGDCWWLLVCDGSSRQQSEQQLLNITRYPGGAPPAQCPPSPCRRYRPHTTISLCHLHLLAIPDSGLLVQLSEYLIDQYILH